MTDPREAILARLTEIVQAFPGYETAGRNLVGLPDESLPAIALLDGSETAEDTDPRRPHDRARRVVMVPEIFVALAGLPEDAGPALNQRRMEIINAVTFDAALIALTWNEDGARYEGSETGMTLEGGMIADLVVRFSIPYRLRPKPPEPDTA